VSGYNQSHFVVEP